MSPPDNRCADASAGRPASAAGTLALLRAVASRHRGRLLITYALFNLENLVRLALPLALGWAISDLLGGRCAGVFAFVLAELAYLTLGAGRRRYDTRAFTGIAAGLATSVVLEQRAGGVGESVIAARTKLVRDLVDFYERDVPTAVTAAYSLAGGLAMLAWFDPWLAVLAAVTAAPAWRVSRWFGRVSFRLAGALNDEAEREVAVIRGADAGAVAAHYERMARTQVRSSDAQAWCFVAIELCGLLLTALAVVRGVASGIDAGGFYALFRYVTMVTFSLDGFVLLSQQLARLRDVCGRVSAAGPAGNAAGEGLLST